MTYVQCTLSIDLVVKSFFGAAVGIMKLMHALVESVSQTLAY